MTRFALLAALAAVACSAPATQPTRPTGPQDPPPAEPEPSQPAGQICGTRGAKECPADQFCNHPLGAQCGMADAPGRCEVRPGGACPANHAPVCGCDGKTYSNACAAATAGTGIMSEGDCPAP